MGTLEEELRELDALRRDELLSEDEYGAKRADLMQRFATPQPPTEGGRQVEFDKQEQVAQVQPFIVPGETLHAVFDCKGSGTGFVAVTSKRLIFYDKAFLGKRKALTSVPFSQVSAVSTIDEGRGLLGTSSELVVKTGPEAFSFEFRGGDKAQRAYLLIMNELLQHEPA